MEMEVKSQTWNMSKNLHDRIFGPKTLHTKNAQIATALITMKQCIHVCLTISNLGHFLVEFNWMCKNPSSFRVKSRFLCVNCVLLRKLCMTKRCFLEKFTPLSRECCDKSEGRGKKNLVSCIHLGSSGKDGTRPKVTPSQKLEAIFFVIPLRMSPKTLIFFTSSLDGWYVCILH